MRDRRRALAALGFLGIAPSAFAQALSAKSAPARFSSVVPGYRIRFPEDEGSHPDFRTEWWYVTGWLERAGGAPAGFQITFFRARPEIDDANPSAFTARQLVVAHAASSARSRGRLLHDQRIA